MKSLTRVKGFCSLLLMTAGLGAFFLVAPITARAQTAGNNAVCTSTTGCSFTTGTIAFIDASTLIPSGGGTICTVLYDILSSATYSYPSTGAVIDARGLPGATGISMTCAGTTPWNNRARAA